MSRLLQLWRTTTVRLTAVFMLLFVIFSILLLTFLAYQSSIQIQQQQTRAIDREVEALERIDRRQGVRGVVFAVARLASVPGPGIYYLGDNSGLQIVGNIDNIPANVLESEGIFSFDYTSPGFDQEDTNAEGPEGYAYNRYQPADADSLILVRGALTQAALWGERRWTPAERFTFEAGLRMEVGEKLENAGPLRLSPRLSARFAPTPELSFSAGLGRSFQYAFSSMVLPGVGRDAAYVVKKIAAPAQTKEPAAA